MTGYNITRHGFRKRKKNPCKKTLMSSIRIIVNNYIFMGSLKTNNKTFKIGFKDKISIIQFVDDNIL